MSLKRDWRRQSVAVAVEELESDDPVEPASESGSFRVPQVCAVPDESRLAATFVKKKFV